MTSLPDRPSLRTLRSQAIGHVLSLIGSYRGLSRVGVIHTVGSADANVCRWILAADSEELRAALRVAGCFGPSSDVPAHMWQDRAEYRQ
jgi:hypothetical protein